ncbi:hypothetical protein CDD80_6735 [Ophiocordyceps camponoti-rufipedis]|uniref:Uncharacterized protein n=1 Tax=Ophiocordyceps camponoti-rufipedis TaxID=2004952 RepID=A0A2C5XEE9_9HYPO|nr:hypothetical protein CDD80_6735 [Ophiocordyceps camponoti-rufipedis]
MNNHTNSGARIDPSLVGYMAEDRDNAAAGRQEALVSMPPTSIGLAIQPDVLPFVIDGEIDVFLATPRAQASAAQLPQTRAISFLNSFQSAFHGCPNDRHHQSASLQTDFAAAARVQSPPPPPGSDLFDSNVVSSVHRSWSPLLMNPGTWSPFSMPNQAVHQEPQQRYGDSQTTSSYQTPRHIMSPDRAGQETFAVYSPAMSPAGVSASSAETARQAAALLMFDPIPGPPVGIAEPFPDAHVAVEGLGPTAWGMSLQGPPISQLSSSRGPSRVSYNPSETGSSHSLSTYLSQPSSRSREHTAAVAQGARTRTTTAADAVFNNKCYPVEGTKWCKKCVDKGRTSSCDAFYFMDLVEEGSTQFTENHSICRDLLLQDDWRFMDVGQLLKHMELLGLSSFILAKRGDQILYELDLCLCHKYLIEASHKLTLQCLIQSFVREQRKEKGWETCVRIGDASARDAIGALALFDDGPVKATYLIRRHNNTVEICYDKPSLLVANVLSLIFGRQVECAALWRLHKQLPKHQQMSAKHLGFLARQLLTLRWRVSVDERHRAMLCQQVDRKRMAGRFERDTAGAARMERLEKRIERDKTLCRKLYVCFCYIRQKRGVSLSSFGDLSHQYARTQRVITEQLPRSDSREEFGIWMQGGWRAIEEAGLLDMESRQPLTFS